MEVVAQQTGVKATDRHLPPGGTVHPGTVHPLTLIVMISTTTTTHPREGVGVVEGVVGLAEMEEIEILEEVGGGVTPPVTTPATTLVTLPVATILQTEDNTAKDEGDSATEGG